MHAYQDSSGDFSLAISLVRGPQNVMWDEEFVSVLLLNNYRKSEIRAGGNMQFLHENIVH